MVARAQADKIRRQLLRGMVDENVETIEGRPLGTLRRERQRRLSRIRRWTAVASSVALVLVAAVLVAARNTNGSPDHVATVPIETAGISAHDYTVTSPPAGDRIARDLASGGVRSLVPAVIPLAVQRVAIDAGHGGIDGGTSVGYGLVEKDLTRDIASRLTTLLEGAGCDVVLTRNGDDAISLKERASLANRSRADLFVSIHINWLPDRTARGFETYYLGPTDDPFLRRLAAAENKDSGFALADYRRLLEGIYADVRRDQSRLLATTVQTALYETLVDDNPEIVSRGVMSAPFVVLVATEMPAILAEVACLSNDREARLLAIPRYRQRIATALYTGVLRYSQTINSSVIADPKGTTG